MSYLDLRSVDADGLHEYSVVYTDRSVNHMSAKFQRAFNEVTENLQETYAAHTSVLIPGGGSLAMEAVARQFVQTGETCLIVRHGWFSYRWSQIIETAKLTDAILLHKAEFINALPQAALKPASLKNILADIMTHKPAVVFMPHVETSAGIMVEEDYIRQIADAVHEVSGLLVVDCIASGCIWLDMQQLGIDVLISAPQKTWSSMPGFGMVMLSVLATRRLEATQSSSFSIDLKQWRTIAHAYANGGHAYHTTLATDAICQLAERMKEMRSVGLAQLQQRQIELGQRFHQLLDQNGIRRVAAAGCRAMGVIVCYAPDERMQSGRVFAEQGMQIAAGVPLACDEPDHYSSFRIGLFGLDKLRNIDSVVKRFAATLQKVLALPIE